MLVSTMVRRGAALLVVLVAATACSDATTAPVPRARLRPSFDLTTLRPADSRFGDNSTGLKQPDGSYQTTFVVDPNVSQAYTFGGNWIYFPAHSICDPATSGYGTSTWDSPCTPLNKPITITVNWSHQGQYTVTEFSPALRFVPSAGPSGWVVLSLSNWSRLNQLKLYDILYCSQNVWINESLTDPTLYAWLDFYHNSVLRRIKHFSGYMVAAANSADMGGLGDASY